jgi:Tfp pilus assembly protein FimT
MGGFPQRIRTLRRKIKRQPLTLLEVVIVILLVGLIAGGGTVSLTDMLRQHRQVAALDQFKDLLQELQIEALALRSDVQLILYKDKKGWKAQSKTSEKILRTQTVDLHGVSRVTFNTVSKEKIALDIFSTGRFSPAGVLCLKRDAGDVEIDLRQPLQIKFSSIYPPKDGNHQSSL